MEKWERQLSRPNEGKSPNAGVDTATKCSFDARQCEWAPHPKGLVGLNNVFFFSFLCLLNYYILLLDIEI